MFALPKIFKEPVAQLNATAQLLHVVAPSANPCLWLKT
jgi:hypothetical protein